MKYLGTLCYLICYLIENYAKVDKEAKFENILTDLVVISLFNFREFFFEYDERGRPF